MTIQQSKKVTKMRPVNGGAGIGQAPNDTSKKPKKGDAEKSRKVRRDEDSSDESQSEEKSQKIKKPLATMKPKKTAQKEVSIAPHSTSNPPPSATEPKLRPSKREAFQKKVKREKEAGEQGLHRKREVDLSGHRAELKALERARHQKELGAALVAQSKAAGGHLDVSVLNSEDAEVLAQVLRTTPSIRSLRLNCNLGGKSIEPDKDPKNPGSVAMKPVQEVLDEDSFWTILSSCVNVQHLDVSGCRLKEKSWLNLSDLLRSKAALRSLTLGNRDYLNGEEFKIFLIGLSLMKNLRELIIEDTEIFKDAYVPIMDAITKSETLLSVTLKNLDLGTRGQFRLDDFFNSSGEKGSTLSHLSLVGCKPYFPKSSSERLIKFMIASANKAQKLLSLDLTDCGYSEDESDVIATIVDAFPALEEIKMEGNAVSDAARASFEKTCKRNQENNLKRERAEQVAAAAYDLLVPNASVPPRDWPEELSRALAQNSPAATIKSLATLIGEDPASLHRMDQRDTSDGKPDKSS